MASRKHSIKTHFPKDRNCEVCLRTRIPRALRRRRTGEAVLRAETFGDLMAANHKVLNEGGESQNNHRYAVVAQDLATQWIQSYPCITTLLRRRRRVYESFSSRQKGQKLYTLPIRWNLKNPVKIYHGITEFKHLIDARRMALLKERYAE